MNDKLGSAMNLLRLVRSSHEAIGVAVSFGKDSLVVLDLCCRMFGRVEAFYMYRVRGLKIVRNWADDVWQRYRVKVWMVPHFDLSRCYRNAVLQPHWDGLHKAPRITMRDVETYFRARAGVEWLAYGWRRNDSFSRAVIMKQCGGYDPDSRRVFPLRRWRRDDVVGYLADHGIEVPDGLGRKEQGGLDFHPGAISALRRGHPEDYERVVRDFPFAEMQLRGDRGR